MSEEFRFINIQDGKPLSVKKTEIGNILQFEIDSPCILQVVLHDKENKN